MIDKKKLEGDMIRIKDITLYKVISNNIII